MINHGRIVASGTVYTDHGRIVAPGQIWRSNDPRRLRAVRIVSFMHLEPLLGMTDVIVENVVTGKRTVIAAASFTVGPRGWSLLQEVNRWRS